MGQVTIFEKPNCTYCAKVYSVLETQTACVVKELQDAGYPNADIKIKRINCSADAALASLCIRLTGTFTVPHIFFNEEYMGDATKFLCLDKVGKEGCTELYNKLKNIATKPAPNPEFPPKPDAAMVKVTERVAYSSQPTTRQLEGLAAFGLRTVLNILRPDSPAYNPNEEAIMHAKGLQYVHCPIHVINNHSIQKALETLERLEAPILVHDDTGQVAGLVVLLHAAQIQSRRHKVNIDTVMKWGNDLGLELGIFRDQIASTVNSTD